MASDIHLHYFHGRGIGEPIRLLLTVGEVPFRDHRYSVDFVAQGVTERVRERGGGGVLQKHVELAVVTWSRADEKHVAGHRLCARIGVLVFAGAAEVSRSTDRSWLSQPALEDAKRLFESGSSPSSP